MRKLTEKQKFERKIREYRRILKDDHDWDWEYIIRLLRYKLSRTRICILKNKIVLDAPEIAKQIADVEILLKRVEDDRYYQNISKDFHKKYGRQRKVKRQSLITPGKLITAYEYKNETSKNRNLIIRENLKLHDRAERMRSNDLKKAFALMHKNMQGWWD